MHRIACTLAALLIASAAAAGTPPAPPPAEVRNVPRTLHGVTIDDPYRWLEDTRSAPAQAWLQGQAAQARSVLDRIEGRETLGQRLTELSKAQGDALYSVMRMPGDRWYYLKRASGERLFKLVMRQGLAGAEQVLVDPERESLKSGVPHAINYYRPSWDGRHVAYGMSAGGSENASLYILHVASGRLVGKPVPRVHETPVHWLPDSRSLTFTQLADLPPGAPETDFYKDSQVLWLRLAAPLSARPVFGPKATPALGLARLDVAELITVPGSRWVVARTTDTTVPEGKLFVAPLASLGRPNAPWRAIASESDKIIRVQLRGDELVLATQAATPRRKIVAVDLRRPSLAEARLLAAEPGEGALEDFSLTPSGLVAELRLGASVVLRRYARGDVQGQAVPAPAIGSAGLASSPAHDSEKLLYRFSGWTEPSRWFGLEGDRSTEVELGRRAVPPGLPQIEVTDVTLPSHDGVRVPMTILHKKGLALDGTNPVLLHGYGAYGLSDSAHYSNNNMVWIERGGVVAHLNPRGSGAYGDDWHRAGFKATKPNTWKDGIAAARYLIERGYGSARTMAIMGTSAGGIFAGRAVTEAPELFAAAILDVGLLDAVRAEESANGATNTSEFGTVQDPTEMRALLAMSTYHAIKDNTAYPGVLLIHGMNDPRVDVWHSSKTAARLQAASAQKPGAKPALLRLDMQAGHGVGSTLTQRQAMAADIQSFLLWQMGKVGLRD